MAPPIKDYSVDPVAIRMAEMYRAGMTLAVIGKEFAVPIHRVHYILGRVGVSRVDGGVAKKAAQKRADASKRVDDRRMRVYGCTQAALESLLGADVKVATDRACMAYLQQQKHAGNRGIDFLMTFPEWWSIWQESGRWNERGRGNGYVMARKGDIGPYAVGNVFICTASQNSKDSFIKTPADIRQKKREATMKAREAPDGNRKQQRMHSNQ